MKRNLIVILTILACSLVACKPGQKERRKYGKRNEAED